MRKILRSFMVSLMFIAVVLMSAVGSYPVYADDGAPTDVPDGETVSESPDEGTVPDDAAEGAPVDTPAEGTVPDDAAEGAPVDAPAEGTVPDDAAEGTTDTSTVEAAPETPNGENQTAEEHAAVAEALQLVPEGTEVVVVVDGEIVSLATEAAAEAILTGDPIWCPGIPSAGGCTGPHSSFADLITELATGAFPGPGIIWVEGSYNPLLDNSPIVFNGLTLSTLANSNLTIQGGWTGDGAGTIAGSSTLDVPITITGWQGTVTLNNIIVSGTTGTGLTVTTTGNVNITDSQFNNNANGTGLRIISNGSIGLTNVNAYSNDTGAILDTTNGVGNISVTSSNFGNTGLGNTWTGLHAESGGAITLTTVVASDNGTNGAYLVAEGDITVTGSTFNENVHFNYPQDPGLHAISNGGNISLTNVTAYGNDYGAGAVLVTNNTGVINVAGGSQFNGNGTFGIQAQSQDGSITLDNITASLNAVKGAYLKSYGLGNIGINNNSSFVENGSYGIYAYTSQGAIDLDNVTVTGNNITDYGAVLKSYSGDISVTNSSFNSNTAAGLVIVTNGQVTLHDVIARQNGGNGAEVYSTYTYGCRCPGEVPTSTGVVSVEGGEFTNNGEYGLQVLPGTAGILQLSPTDPPYFGAIATGDNNALGDVLLDTTYVPGKCGPCICEKCCKPDGKHKKHVEVPFTGNPPILQDCEQFSGTTMELPSGTSANVGCPFTGYSNLEGLLEEDLPGELGAGTTFVDGINVSLTDLEGNPSPDGSTTITISFKLPTDGGSYSIQYWDPTLNDGAGGWVQMPLFEMGTSFPLNPDNPEDGRIINSGVQQIGDTLVVTVNFPGIFVLVSP
jgi:hypothetical protein